jgi:hypothetical protein
MTDDAKRFEEIKNRRGSSAHMAVHCHKDRRDLIAMVERLRAERDSLAKTGGQIAFYKLCSRLVGQGITSLGWIAETIGWSRVMLRVNLRTGYRLSGEDKWAVALDNTESEKA